MCGDMLVAGAEECEDGNWAGGDGCSSACRTEPFYRSGSLLDSIGLDPFYIAAFLKAWIPSIRLGSPSIGRSTRPPYGREVSGYPHHHDDALSVSPPAARPLASGILEEDKADRDRASVLR